MHMWNETQMIDNHTYALSGFGSPHLHEPACKTLGNYQITKERLLFRLREIETEWAFNKCELSGLNSARHRLKSEAKELLAQARQWHSRREVWGVTWL